MTLSAQEFIRRFLLHVLPNGFVRTRHYGFLSNRRRSRELATCRQLLNVPPPKPEETLPTLDWRSRYEKLTGEPVNLCPRGRQGRLVKIQTILPGHPSRTRAPP